MEIWAIFLKISNHLHLHHHYPFLGPSCRARIYSSLFRHGLSVCLSRVGTLPPPPPAPPPTPILQRLTKFFFLFPRQGDERETERHTQREKKRNHNNNNTHLIAKTGDNFKWQKQNHFVNIKQSFYLYSHLVFPFNLGQFLDSKKKNNWTIKNLFRLYFTLISLIPLRYSVSQFFFIYFTYLF